MTKQAEHLIQGVILIGIIFLTALLIGSNSQPVQGSVNDSSAAYNSTSTEDANGSHAMTSPQILSLGYGTLGSVVITGASTGIINLYDATSTGAHSDYATTTLASFPASTAAGTYTFDAKYIRGLVVELVGTTGTSTITWKK